ncbi:chromosome partitioning protein [Tibeticola sediminis]|uniref:Chromosome partitioning protein n=1 Tax=Tibeticola sediminis TaxID=1917811 RepID=A0A3N4UJX3_9BURK|nr:ParA family protein [Tibeticola sediminis]RPE67589.1 chromosome partitioning protein [Tibeticola sediminis]
MPVIVVANPKGGVGKSTLATQVAGYYARQGHAVMLGDLDRQQSARLWLGLRPPQAAAIAAWDLGEDEVLRPPRGTTHVVIDTPAGLHGKRLKEVLKRADRVLVPLQASVFDIYATRAFVDELLESRHAGRFEAAVVGMRVDERTHAAEQFRRFVETLGLPLLATLRDTQNYVHLAAHGLTLFDVNPSRVEKDLAQWQPLCRWLDKA